MSAVENLRLASFFLMVLSLLALGGCCGVGLTLFMQWRVKKKGVIHD